MTSTFDRYYFKDLLQALINNKKAHINQFVRDSVFKLVDLLCDKMYLNINTIKAGYDGSSGWTKGYDIIVTFKIYGAETAIVINHKGYYELKYQRFGGDLIFTTKQFIKGDEEALVEQLKKYYDEHPLKAWHYVNRIGEYAVFKNNQLNYSIFKQLSEELEEYSTVAGYKDQRYPVNQYIEDSFQEIFYTYKYAVVFKKNNNMLMLGVEVNKNVEMPINLVAMTLNLASSKEVQLIDSYKNLTSSSNKKLIDFINS